MKVRRGGESGGEDEIEGELKVLVVDRVRSEVER